MNALEAELAELRVSLFAANKRIAELDTLCEALIDDMSRAEAQFCSFRERERQVSGMLIRLGTELQERVSVPSVRAPGTSDAKALQGLLQESLNLGHRYGFETAGNAVNDTSLRGELTAQHAR